MQSNLDVGLVEIHTNIYVFSTRLLRNTDISSRFYHELIRMSSPYESCVGLGTWARRGA
jgi:hypothetical protein